MNHHESSKETTRIAPEYCQSQEVEKTFTDKRFGCAENRLLEVSFSIKFALDGVVFARAAGFGD